MSGWRDLKSCKGQGQAQGMGKKVSKWKKDSTPVVDLLKVVTTPIKPTISMEDLLAGQFVGSCKKRKRK